MHLGQILSNFLAGRGYAVQAVTDGRAALEALRAEAYDVALLDIVMPELDGLEVLKQVRADADPPEASSSPATARSRRRSAAMKLGAYDYVAKPYRMAEIDVLVRRAWEKRRLASENVLLQSQLARAGGATEIVTQYAPMQAVLAWWPRWRRATARCSSRASRERVSELVAHMLHRLSERTGPFVDVSCAVAERGHAGERPVRARTRGLRRRARAQARAHGVGRGRYALARRDQRTLAQVAEQAAPRAGPAQLLSRWGHAEDRGRRAHPRRVQSRSRSARRPGARSATICSIASTRSRSSCPRCASAPWTFRSSRDIPAGVRKDASAHPHRRRRRRAHAISLAGQRARTPQRDRASRAPRPRSSDRRERPAGAVAGRGSAVSSSAAPCRSRRSSAGISQPCCMHTHWHQGRAAASLGISSKTLYRKIREYGFVRPNGVE